jgi:hypothetical protein
MVIEILVNLSLILTKHHIMKTHGGVDVQLHAFLTPALHRLSLVGEDDEKSRILKGGRRRTIYLQA